MRLNVKPNALIHYLYKIKPLQIIKTNGGIMIEIISALVAVGAFSFTVATFIANRYQNRINQADQLLFQINTLIIQYPDIVAHSEERKLAYSAIVWNFMETVYRLRLQNMEHLQPAMRQFATDYGQWFLENQKLYRNDFVTFIRKTYPI